MGIVPPSIPRLIELGFEVCVERGSGALAGYSDPNYEEVGAKLVSKEDAWNAPVVVKVNCPTFDEIEGMTSGSTVISLLLAARNEAEVAKLAQQGVIAVALDQVPRVTRAQKMDVLSSMANIAGYRAILEAAAEYGGFFPPQVTAAGTDRPARILIIGAGVAGLAAIAAGRAMGAEVRAFDTRAAAKEQVESLGAEFLEVQFEESGEGGGGYAKLMSKEFIAAEMELFRTQAANIDIIVTTALVPGKKAPVLLPEDVVNCLKPGSVIVDLAAAQQGNCAFTVPGTVVERNGVKIIGYTDLASRMAPTASRFFSANVTHLLEEMVEEQQFSVDLDDPLIRAATVTHKGAILPKAPMQAPTPRTTTGKPPAGAKSAKPPIMKPTHSAWGTSVAGLVLIGLLFVLGRFAPSEFLHHFTVFILACFVGWQVIWSVKPALHTPLMSVTNAISGIIIVGGMLNAGADEFSLATILSAVAMLVASINIVGGFAVTQRMLRMFRKGN